MFSFGFTTRDLIRVAYAAAFGFLGAFIPLATGLSKFHNFGEVKAAFLALLPAGIAAGFSALKNALLADGSKVKG